MGEVIEYTIREAGAGDIVGIVYVQATSWINSYQNALAKISEEDIRSINFESKLSEWQHMLKSPNYQIWVAVEDTGVVAFISVLKDGQQAEIHQQHTLPDYVRRGIGSQLLTKAIRWAEPTPLSLRIPVYIQSGQDFYREHGFRVDENGEVDFINLPSGAQIPTVMLRYGNTSAPSSSQTTKSTISTTHNEVVHKPTQVVEPRPASKLVGRAKLAKLSGVRASTIKYYTETGLLPYEQAEAKLARRYDRQSALKRLKEIKKMRADGLRIAEIKSRLF